MIPPPNHVDRDAAVLVSGGLDSLVLSVDLTGRFRRVAPLYVRSGLRWEVRELASLTSFYRAVGSTYPNLNRLTILDEPIADVYGEHWSREGRPGVPDAGTDAEAVYLPGRNLLLAAKAAVWCRLRGVETLAFGILRANPFSDGTPAFFHDYEAVLNRALGGDLRLVRPYEGLEKGEVVRRGAGLGLPMHLSFSCLGPVDGRHCGSCNKCAERRKAFRDAAEPDLTLYATRRTSPTCSE